MLKYIVITAVLSLFSYNAIAGGGLFGSREFVSDSYNLFPKWVGVLEKHKNIDLQDVNCEKKPKGHKCHMDKWLEFLKTIEHKDTKQKLDIVNRHMNRHPYIIDPVNWGVPDYWASPKEFFHKDGDCEDYAISKFFSLKYLGVNSSDMRIVVVQDMNLGIAHAVLTVSIDGKNYILDNQIDYVVEDSKIRHYHPIYSINENKWWRHG